MDVLVRHTFLILFMWLMLAGVCLGKEVYLKDGGIIDSQSAWRRGDKVFVLVNRDIIADFDQSEIDLRRTFPKSAPSSRHLHRKVSAHAVTAATKPAPVPAQVAPAPAVAPQAPKPAASTVPSPVAAPVATTSPQPVKAPTAPAAPASPPDKADMMKKALEMQKNATPQQGGAAQMGGGIPIFLSLMILAVCLLIIVAQWKIFQRAGQAGWKSLIPFYNMYILMEIAGKPGWWMFLLLVPLVGVVILLLAMLSLAKKFRRSELFGVGIFLLPMIFLPVLAFGGSEYEG
jgi:hypothetical protein